MKGQCYQCTITIDASCLRLLAGERWRAAFGWNFISAISARCGRYSRFHRHHFGRLPRFHDIISAIASHADDTITSADGLAYSRA